MRQLKKKKLLCKQTSYFQKLNLKDLADKKGFIKQSRQFLQQKNFFNTLMLIE